MIGQSFKSCTLTVTVDGSKDQEISASNLTNRAQTVERFWKNKMLLINDKCLHIDPFAATDSDIADTNNEMFIIENDDDIEI